MDLSLIDEVDRAELTHQIRLWHEAFEHHFHRSAILSIAEHAKRKKEEPRPDALVFFCIDDREESIRRYVEELDSMVATYGVVGFFGVDMKFRALKNKRLIAQCPPVVNPRRIVKEITRDRVGSHVFRKLNIQKAGSSLALYYNSRSLLRGSLTTFVFGFLSLLPMFLQVFFPNSSKRWKKKILKRFNPEPETELLIEAKGPQEGYTKKEMAEIVGAILKMSGLKSH